MFLDWSKTQFFLSSILIGVPVDTQLLCNSLDNTNSQKKTRIVTYLGNHNKRYVKSHYLLEKCRQEILYYRIIEKKNPIKIELKKN
jgi:hypothetical protein